MIVVLLPVVRGHVGCFAGPCMLFCGVMGHVVVVGFRLVRFGICLLRICERFMFDDGGRVDGGAAKLL